MQQHRPREANVGGIRPSRSAQLQHSLPPEVTPDPVEDESEVAKTTMSSEAALLASMRDALKRKSAPDAIISIDSDDEQDINFIPEPVQTTEFFTDVGYQDSEVDEGLATGPEVCRVEHQADPELHAVTDGVGMENFDESAGHDIDALAALEEEKNLAQDFDQGAGMEDFGDSASHDIDEWAAVESQKSLARDSDEGSVSPITEPDASKVGCCNEESNSDMSLDDDYIASKECRPADEDQDASQAEEEPPWLQLMVEADSNSADDAATRVGYLEGYSENGDVEMAQQALESACPRLVQYLVGHPKGLQGKPGKGGKGGKAGKGGKKRFFSDTRSEDVMADKVVSGCWACGKLDHESQNCIFKRCFLCSEQGHEYGECPMRGQWCTNCGRQGHTSAACPDAIYRSALLACHKRTLTSVRCLSCGEEGHIQCRKLPATDFILNTPSGGIAGFRPSMRDHIADEVRVRDHDAQATIEKPNAWEECTEDGWKTGSSDKPRIKQRGGRKQKRKR
jgi:hypothetical protein